MPVELISNRFINRVLNSSRAERHIPWPAECLGAYGANESTGEDLDAFVAEETGLTPGETLPLDQTGGIPVRVSTFPGRNRKGDPVVVVVLSQV